MSLDRRHDAFSCLVSGHAALGYAGAALTDEQ
jgi:hypothetical protein